MAQVESDAGAFEPLRDAFGEPVVVAVEVVSVGLIERHGEAEGAQGGDEFEADVAAADDGGGLGLALFEECVEPLGVGVGVEDERAVIGAGGAHRAGAGGPDELVVMDAVARGAAGLRAVGGAPQ